MCAGAGTLFLANILTKRFLSPQDYLSLSYLITITTILNSFALGGMEQLIVRYSTTENSKTKIDKTSLKIILYTLAISLAVFPIALTIIFPDSLTWPWLVTLTLNFTLTLINYNLYRVRRNFVEAQLTAGAWKFIIFIGVLVCYFGIITSLEAALLAGIGLTLILNLYLARKNLRHLRVENSQHPIMSTGLAFSFSLAIMTVLGTFDRVLAEKLSGPALFAEYIYFSMIVIYPFNMIASYIGFKEAIYFKTDFSVNLVTQKIVSIFVKITAIFIAFGLCIHLAAPLTHLIVTWQNMILSYALICIKCIYSIFSAIMGSRASAKEIWLSNVYSAISITIISAAFITTNSSITINSLLALFAALWLSRTLIFTKTLLLK